MLFPVGGKATELQHAVDVLEAFLDMLGGPGPMPALDFPARSGWSWKQDLRQGDVVDGIVDALRVSALNNGPADLVVLARQQDRAGDPTGHLSRAGGAFGLRGGWGEGAAPPPSLLSVSGSAPPAGGAGRQSRPAVSPGPPTSCRWPRPRR